MEVQTIIDKVHLGIFENKTANSNAVHFEQEVSNILNKATEHAGKIGKKSLSRDNRFLMIVESGSKGNLINISQMVSCLGQQSVDGKRISYGFDDRTLPHFKKYDDSPNARGFVENSYITGLSAPELFFHAMAGRTGLIDTAVKTSSTGYIQRRLVKGLEDLMVNYDMTVRNNKGKIIQFQYGDDNFDATKVENQILPLIEMTVEDMYMFYDLPGMNEAENNIRLAVFTKAAVSRMNKQRAQCKEQCLKYTERLMEARDLVVEKVFANQNEKSVRIPIAFQYIIANIQGQLHLDENSAVDITPLEAFKMIESYFERICAIPCVKVNRLIEIAYYYYLTPRDLLIKRRFHEKGLRLLLETIVLKFKEALVHPGEMVGVVAAQGCGEPTTQLTLNSCCWSDKITVKDKNGYITVMPIGAFTEKHIELSRKIDYNAEKDTTYAELDKKETYYEVPCATEDGCTVWRRIEAVTQHPVINEDGTNTMLKVKLKTGQEVTATKAKSFLQLIDGKIQGVHGKDLKVGDYLPVSRKPLDYTESHQLDLRTILPMTEYIYGSEMQKAAAVMHEHHWWKKHANITFTLPFQRSDSVVVAIKKSRKGQENRIEYEPGRVYTKTNIICNYQIPEIIDLDYDFGYLLGAYCAEGCTTHHQISISNNDSAYFEPIIRVCDKFKLTYKMYTHENKNGSGWTSSDMRIYSTILTCIITNLCGKMSHLKQISPKVVFSNRECVIGFLDAYISGDGTISQNKQKIPTNISISSTSKNMLTDVSVMLRNLGVSCTIGKGVQVTHNNRGTLPENIQPVYGMYIGVKDSQILASMLNLTIADKQEKLQKLVKRSLRSASDIFPNLVNGELVKEPRNGRMMDLRFAPIVSIEEVPNTSNYAYDLTVEETRTFDLYNGLCLYDTFHNTGVASKTGVTRGVPRIEEILRLTKNPKNPSMTVFMNPQEEMEIEKVNNYAVALTHTKLIDVVQSVQVYFDPMEQTTQIEEDRVLLEQFYHFEEMVAECMGEDGTAEPGVEPAKSKWVIRMEIDKEILIEKNLTMDDIHFAVANSHYGKDVHCVFSDYNMDKLVFRIRTNANIFDKKPKRGVANPLDQSDEIYLLKNFQDALLNQIVLRGIHGVKNVLSRKLQNTVFKEEGKYVRKDTWVLDSTGSNLLDTLALDFIDATRTTTNDIKEVFDVLGIEAARKCIHTELVDVMAAAGASINYHHTSLLCDRMTCNKDMVSIFRSGLLNDNVGPIAKATFEVHTEVFLDAARHAEFDHMKGVSANIMCGQQGDYGTNAFQVVLDMKAYESLKGAAHQRRDVNREIEEGLVAPTDDTTCGPRMEIQNNIASIRRTTDHAAACLDDGYDIGF